MFRFLISFFIFLPLVSVAFFSLYSPAEYLSGPALAAASEKSPKPAGSKADPLKLRREDLVEGEDKGWYPELEATPEDYLEEMELPQRSEVPDDTKNT